MKQIKVRKTWGNLSPITRVDKIKTRYSRKIKHKGLYLREE